jgi:hypothetical protein
MLFYIVMHSLNNWHSLIVLIIIDCLFKIKTLLWRSKLSKFSEHMMESIGEC